jgi:Omp85 superfamily domain
MPAQQRPQAQVHVDRIGGRFELSGDVYAKRAQLAARRGKQAYVELLPAHLAAERVREPALELGLYGARIDEQRRERDESGGGHNDAAERPRETPFQFRGDNADSIEPTKPGKQRWWCAAALALAAAQALGADPAVLGKEIGVDPAKELAEARLFEDLVVAPIPISNPTIGTGLAVVVMPFYHVAAGTPLSNTAVAAGVTSSGSWGVGAAQSTRLRGDDVRIDGFLGYVDLRYDFYGAGSSAGMSGQSVPILQKGLAFAPELLFRIARGMFLGLRYRGVRVETAVEGDPVLPPEVAVVLPDSITIVSSGIGPRFTFDTRDNDMNPSSGLLVDLRANFADDSLGSDFDYETYDLGANYYRRLGRGVLALRGYLCQASDATPLFDLCLFGAGSDLRGYEVGRFRDRAMVAAQAEYRFPLAGRFGGVVFGGWGKVAPSFSEMGEEPDLPSVGFGLRWLAAEKARVNLSIDIARGRDSTGLYVYVKESF